MNFLKPVVPLHEQPDFTVWYKQQYQVSDEIIDKISAYYNEDQYRLFKMQILN